jgi:hypothetical protein
MSKTISLRDANQNFAKLVREVEEISWIFPRRATSRRDAIRRARNSTTRSRRSVFRLTADSIVLVYAVDPRDAAKHRLAVRIIVLASDLDSRADDASAARVLQRGDP